MEVAKDVPGFHDMMLKNQALRPSYNFGEWEPVNPGVGANAKLTPISNDWEDKGTEDFQAWSEQQEIVVKKCVRNITEGINGAIFIAIDLLGLPIDGSVRHVLRINGSIHEGKETYILVNDELGEVPLIRVDYGEDFSDGCELTFLVIEGKSVQTRI